MKLLNTEWWSERDIPAPDLMQEMQFEITHQPSRTAGQEENDLPTFNLGQETGFQVTHQPSHTDYRARRGVLTVQGVRLRTPALFPVLNLLTGPPSLHRNGATHKFLKHQLIFEDRRRNFMSEVLHFTDYPFRPATLRKWFPRVDDSSKGKTLDYWVQCSFKELDKAGEGYHPLFFLDSGGFRLLFNRDVDIAEYGYSPIQESILQLQLDYGADIITSLDYPVPPFLKEEQALERIQKSVRNAVTLMRLLYREGKTDITGKCPFPVLAVHGQTPGQIRSCIRQLFQELAQEGFQNEPFGIGIGSLVPLRLSSNADKVVMIVKAAIDTLYEPDVQRHFNPNKILVHVFGITGNMIPFLTHLGVDTFDSSSYIKSASALDYYDPVTWNSLPFRKLESISCHCNACDGITPEQLRQMQEDLSGDRINGSKKRLGHPAGKFTVNIKSDVYGIIAYHNLNLHDDEIMHIRQAIDAGVTAEHLVQFGQTHLRSQELVEFLAEIDPLVMKALGHVQIKLFPRTREEIDLQHEVSLANDPSDFDLRTHVDYKIPSGKDRLLLLACSQAKPYRSSKTHSSVFRYLSQHVGERLQSCHKVTLSGLYGPVPLEFEDVEAVRTYEYVLSSSAKRQRELIVSRLVSYLETHLREYGRIVAYVTAGAYRGVFEAAFSQVKENYARVNGADALLPTPIILAPLKSHGTGTKDLLSHANLKELLHVLYPEQSAQVAVPDQLQTPEI